MIELPVTIINFLHWFTVLIPKKIFVISQRAVTLLNYELSFTLNIRLIFTPIFGDYTKAGRVIGFFFRLGSIIIGVVVIATLWVVGLVSPLLWYTFWGVLVYYTKMLALPIFVLTSFLYFIDVKDRPPLRVREAAKNPVKSLRPKTNKYFQELQNRGIRFLPTFLDDPQVRFLLIKAELSNESLCIKDSDSTFCKITSSFIKKLCEAPSIDTFNILDKAYEYAVRDNSRYVEIEHLFVAALSGIPKIEALLNSFNSTFSLLENTSSWIVTEREELSKRYFWQEDYKLPVMGGVGKGMTGRVTPALNAVSEDFTRKAQKGLIGKVVGRDNEIKKIAEILSGSKQNIMLIGDPGSGKTSIVRELAHKIVGGIEYPALKFKRIVSIEPGTLIAGTKTAGDIAGRIKVIMDEVEKSGDIVLFIDEIHTLVTGLSGKDSEVSNIFSILEPHLKGNIQFIGATNIENYREFIEPNGAFARLFELIKIEPATKDETMEILEVICKDFERKYKIVITYPALKKVVDLSDKLIHERVLPDKAIDILNRTASSKAHSNKYLTTEDISLEISEVTQVPVAAITESESQKLLNIEDAMKKRVIGQDEAINQVGAALKRARVGIRNENKPIASFLFVGTTGVGKTETAKTLAGEYFGDPKAMIRLDMSEYQQIDSIDRLIGTPDGRNKGILTEAVRTKPFSLILLDEIEKAHANILLAFLQVLDDGRLTDSSGKVIDFTNSIIIATSNVGTKAIQEIASRNGSFEEMSTTAMTEVRNKFAPEFLNRFNGIIVFRPLSPESVKKVAVLMLNRVKKMAEEKGINISFKPELINELVKRGYNPEWGARPLSRVIENSVESYLAVRILEKELIQGDSLELGMEVFRDLPAEV